GTRDTPSLFPLRNDETPAGASSVSRECPNRRAGYRDGHEVREPTGESERSPRSSRAMPGFTPTLRHPGGPIRCLAAGLRVLLLLAPGLVGWPVDAQGAIPDLVTRCADVSGTSTGLGLAELAVQASPGDWARVFDDLRADPSQLWVGDTAGR